jgi:hypothetical protein
MYFENVGCSVTADEEIALSDDDEAVSTDDEETSFVDELTGLSFSEYATSEDELISELDEVLVRVGTKFTLESPSSEHAQNINEVIKETIDNLFINTLLSP